MPSPQTQKVLASTELFGSLSSETLDAIAVQGIERTYKKGQILFTTGDEGDALYVVLEGAVKGYATADDGTELMVGIFEPPSIFGEVAVGDGGPRSATIEVVAPTRVFILPRAQFLAALGEHRELAEAYIAQLTSMIRTLQTKTESLVFLDLQGRVAKLLLELLADRSADGRSLDLNMTQGELASMVGGSRPSVNQVLKTLEGRGYIAIDGKQVVINDVDSLRRLSTT